MENYHLEALEYPKLLELIARYAHSPLGRSVILSTRPNPDISWVEKRYGELRDALRFLDTEQEISLGDLHDVSDILAVAKIPGSVLEPTKILLVKRQLILARIVKSRLTDERFPELRKVAAKLSLLDELAHQIEASLDESGNVKDDASERLSSIRQRIRSLKGEISQRLRRIMNNPAKAKALADRNIHIRFERYTLAVRSDRAPALEGMVIDTSASGKTLFVEPKEIVPLNNTIAKLRREEQEEEEKVLRKLTAKIGFHASSLKENQYVLSQLDAVFAKARFAKEFDATIPQVGTKRELHIVKGRHPLLVAVKGEDTVPMDLKLDANRHTIIITGPNTGGKTVALKTAGLLTLMALSALPVTAHTDSYFYAFHKVLADIGDEQSIENSLSTFSSHVVRLKEICQKADKNSLVLIDELGTGTDPEEGSALAVAIAEYLHKIGSINIITTHHGELKLLAYSTAGMENASVEFDSNTLKPTYRLLVGVPGESNAFIIAKRLGLPEEIVERAKEIKGGAETDTVNWIKRMKQEVERELELAKTARQEALKELEESKSEAERIKNEAYEKAKRLLEEVEQELKKAREKRSSLQIKITKQKIAEERRKDAKEKQEGLKEGHAVKISTFGLTGRVVRISGSKVEVDTGRMRITVPITDVERLKDQEDSIPKAVSRNNDVSITIERSRSSFFPELNIVGKRVDDAIPEVERFLNDGFLVGVKELRVIHGRGEGILKNAVHQYLKEHPLVNHFHLADEDQGGTGVTVVYLNL